MAPDSIFHPNKALWAATIFLGMIFLLRAPLAESFWLDETLSSWITSAGAEEVWHRTLDFQGQSPLYYEVLWLVRQVFGGSEVALRAPSLLFAGCSLVFLARIGSLLFREHAIAPVAVSILISADGFQRAAISARPYALGIACVFGSVFYLLQFAKKKRPVDLVLYGSITVIAFYSHYLFASILLLHVVIAITYGVLRKSFAVALSLVCLMLVPGILHLRHLMSRAGELSFAQPPSIAAFFPALVPLPVLVVGVIALLLAVIWGARWREVKFDRCGALLLGFWIFSPVILFFMASILSGNSILVARYWVWQVGGVGLAFGAVIATISSQHHRTIATVTLLCGLLFRLLTQQWQLEDWRNAAHLAQEEAASEIILFSGLIESESAWLRDSPAVQEYLRAPLSVYGVTKPTRFVGLTESSSDLEEELVGGSLLVSFRAAKGGHRAPQRFIDEATAKGIKVVPIAEGGIVSVYRFVTQRNPGSSDAE